MSALHKGGTLKPPSPGLELVDDINEDLDDIEQDDIIEQYSVKRSGPKPVLSSSVRRRSPNCSQNRIFNVKCELQSILYMVEV
ncbi:hypothetical protein AVEN_128010-1 [Araneus ventricosus]|uniref:Uncharacterized protein n=1 Tax=Araneus ventricosus TaxID=182803 RepID=A0A4Y1ZZG5_ARAVE|nr:hypothetical protein AVEN_128010-1 [Araneus ventricosus]